jgi:hypothetical protein
MPLLFAALALLSPGCLMVTEPVGDIDKAEPDEALVGTWAREDKPDQAGVRIEIPPRVKGNPKGLMRMHILDNKPDGPIWFFVTTVGGEKYGNMCADTSRPADNQRAQFDREGDYARWSKSTGRRYCVFRYEVTGHGLVVNAGDEREFSDVMKKEGFELDDRKEYFKTPAGWFANYLEKNGRDKFFPPGKDERLVWHRSAPHDPHVSR